MKVILFSMLAALLAAVLPGRAQVYLADPAIFRGEDTFYLYGTGHPRGFLVYTSLDLKEWRLSRDSFALKRGDAFGSSGFWAPQVFQHKDSFYMAYTANEQLAIAKAPTPAGPFRQTQFVPLKGTGKQIDPFVFFDSDGTAYLYHVKLQNGNRIFVVEMKPDLSDIVPGTERECIVSGDGWENTAGAAWPVAEGPTVLKHKDVYYLLYSANDFRNKDYAVGYATARSPKGPWTKFAGNPIISRYTLAVPGTGHGDVFADEAGNLYYVFHTHHSGERVAPRRTAIMRLRFRAIDGAEDVLEADAASFRWVAAAGEK
ncbi:glycoside hydrolase family 43 protein [Chitinophaga lutea]